VSSSLELRFVFIIARWQLLSIYGSSNVIKAATYLQSTIFGGIFLGAARMRCQQECYGNKS